MEKGNRYERERGEDESKEEGIKRERERKKESERGKLALVSPYSLVTAPSL